MAGRLIDNYDKIKTYNLLIKAKHSYLINYDEFKIHNLICFTITNFYQVIFFHFIVFKIYNYYYYYFTILKEGNLKDKINQLKSNNQKFSDHEIISYSIKLMKAVEFLHRKGIIHNNINPE